MRRSPIPHRAAMRTTGFFYTNQRRMFAVLDPAVLERINKMGVSASTRKILERLANHGAGLSAPADEQMLDASQLRLDALRLVANHPSQRFQEETRFVGEALRRQLIEEQSNAFIKALFSTSLLGAGETDCSTIYHSPGVTKAAFESLEHYHPAVMNKLVSDGLFRVGFALSRLGKKGDVFQWVDSKPLEVFKNQNFSEDQMSEVWRHVEDRDIQLAMLLLSALRATHTHENDPVFTHLISIPLARAGKGKLLLRDDTNINHLVDAVEEGGVRDVVQYLMDASSKPRPSEYRP